MNKKNKRIAGEISKSLINSRVNEKRILRQTKKLQKSEKQLLRDVRSLIDDNRISEARLMASNLIESRKLIQGLGRLRFFLLSIQSQFKEAQIALMKGETIETIQNLLGKTNKILSAESFDKSFLYLETEMQELVLNLEDNEEILKEFAEFEDPLKDEEEYIDKLVLEIGKVTKSKVDSKINELLRIESLLPHVPLSTEKLSKGIEKQREDEEGI